MSRRAFASRRCTFTACDLYYLYFFINLDLSHTPTPTPTHTHTRTSPLPHSDTFIVSSIIHLRSRGGETRARAHRPSLHPRCNILARTFEIKGYVSRISVLVHTYIHTYTSMIFRGAPRPWEFSIVRHVMVECLPCVANRTYLQTADFVRDEIALVLDDTRSLE